VALANGTVNYTAPAAAGSYSFSYTVKDNFTTPLTSNSATVNLTVSAANTPPTAVADAASTTAGSAIVINLTGNDLQGTLPINPASLALNILPGNGTASANPNGSVNYTAPGPAGTYSFTYTVQDSGVPPTTSNPATVTVTVSAPPTAPTAVADTATTRSGAPITISVLANDTGGTSGINAATVATGTIPGHGSAAANADGTITYTPAAGFSGADSFSYTVHGNNGLTSNAATVSMTVTAQTIAISRAQFTVTGSAWRVDGTVTPAPAAGTTITIYNSATAGTLPVLATVPVVGTAFSWNPGNNPAAIQPNAARRISVQTNQAPPAALNNIAVTLR
jgi:hypothetical protein